MPPTEQAPQVKLVHTKETIMKHLEESPHWLLMAVFDLADGKLVKSATDEEQVIQGFDLWKDEVVALYKHFRSMNPNFSDEELGAKVMGRINEVLGVEGLFQAVLLDACETNIETLVKIANKQPLTTP
jgi:hypothetical protein